MPDWLQYCSPRFSSVGVLDDAVFIWNSPEGPVKKNKDRKMKIFPTICLPYRLVYHQFFLSRILSLIVVFLAHVTVGFLDWTSRQMIFAPIFKFFVLVADLCLFQAQIDSYIKSLS